MAEQPDSAENISAALAMVEHRIDIVFGIPVEMPLFFLSNAVVGAMHRTVRMCLKIASISRALNHIDAQVNLQR